MQELSDSEDESDSDGNSSEVEEENDEDESEEVINTGIKSKPENEDSGAESGSGQIMSGSSDESSKKTKEKKVKKNFRQKLTKKKSTKEIMKTVQKNIDKVDALAQEIKNDVTVQPVQEKGAHKLSNLFWFVNLFGFLNHQSNEKSQSGSLKALWQS